MPIEGIIVPLLRVPLFTGLKPLQITEIARQAERVKYWRGDIITRAGQPADGGYLIVSGAAARVCGGLSTDLEPIETGSLIGEMAMLVEHDHASTIVARDRVLCLKITRAALRAQMLHDISLAEHFQQCITERLRSVAETLRQIDQGLNRTLAIANK